jgi:Flp pilus assembly protein TadD
LPGNWKVVHHAFINIDATPFSRRLAQKQNPPGFDGMLLPETARMPGGQFMSWQPGKVASFAPDGLAWALEKNTDIVLQMHMHPTGKPEPVQPMIGFYFTDQAPTNMAFRVNLNPLLIDIPAGSSNYVVEDNYTVPVDVDVLAVNPHAHYLAKRMEGWANLPDGSRKDLLLIKDWDFNWQGDYRYASPVALPKGSTIAMRFTYDNSSANIRNPSQPPKRVKYGLQTTDEMAELWFQVLAHNADDRNTLAQDFYVHLARSALSYNEQASKDNPNDAEAHTRAGRALVFFNQFPAAMQHYQAAVKANPNYDRAWYELGYINLRMNKMPEAQQAFEQVVKLNPDDFEAQGSLGYICMQKGDLNNAEAHFKAALEINPADDIARGNLEQIQKTKAANSASGSK